MRFKSQTKKGYKATKIHILKDIMNHIGCHVVSHREERNKELLLSLRV